MILLIKKTLCLVILFAFVSGTQAADYKGSKICRGCHKEEYAQWKESPHALAYSDEIFQKSWQDLGSDYACLECHATGTDQQAKTYTHPGVTCESCHGLMSKSHNKEGAEVPLPLTSEVCRDCHKKTYQEWQISQHSQNDIRCFDCHGVHAQTLRSKGGDLLCGACHSKRLEAFAHATHQLEGLHCNSCHMPVSANPQDVIEGAGAAGHTLFVGTEVCGRCHADMVHTSSLLPEMREQLVAATQDDFLTGGKGAMQLYEEVQTLSWMVDKARYKLWTASVMGLLVGLLLGWMFGWYVFEKKRQK